MKRCITSHSLLVLMLLLSSGCKDNDCGCVPPFSSNLMGKWEWVKTITPSGEVLTPETFGYTKSFSFGNSAKINGNYLYIAEDGKDPIVLSEHTFKGQNGFSEGWLLMQFGAKHGKFFLVKNSQNTYPELIATDLVDDYSKGFGEARHYYKRAGVADKP